MSGAIDQAKSAVGTVQRTLPARAWKKYGDARGNVLAGGVAYFAFFSIFPALAVALTLTGFVMQGTPELRDWVVRNLVAGLNDYVPGLVHEGSSPAGGGGNGIYIDDYLNSTTLTWTLLVSVATGLFTGIGWVDGMRQGVRAVFGEDSGGGNFAVVKLRDLGGMAIIGSGVLLSVVSVVATNAAGEFLLDAMGFEPSTWSRWLLAALGFAVSFVIDTLTFLAVFRFLPGADVPLRDLLQGAVLGGIGIGVLKQFGTTIASRSADGGAFVGSAVTLVVLLVLMNLIGRLVLLAAALAAVRAEDNGSLHPDLMAQARLAVPLGPEVPDDLRPGAPRRRVPFLSGVVLGVVGASALKLVRRSGR
ncbi:YhjD/YihY/BrkB family envelope integrity protein [Kineococcus aurantiacus]|uniref:Membrane protein n=1 Tax=Kineococcus aurantiacus TaxID=37633 RepID=A0A7Y9DHZ3_9ACTN|nr:membrane protein [Kineococcus aurantiacus]